MTISNPFTKPPVESSAELVRILKIPRRVWPDKDIEKVTDMMTEKLRAPNGKMRLRPIQALALFELEMTGGLFGPISVGAGKELICFLAPVVMKAKHPLLLMPAHLVRRSEEEMKEYGEHWAMPKNLRIMSFQTLSQANRSKALEVVPPDLVIMNEAHMASHRTAAVTKRLLRHMAKFDGTGVVTVSGSMMTHSPMDFAHLAKWCLQECPLPMDNHTMQEWSDALSEKTSNWNRRDPGALLRLCNEEDLKAEPVIAARRGFRRRLTETPGVVATSGDGDVANANGDAIQLVVRALQYEQDPIVEEHFETLRTLMETPSGWAFSMAMEIWRHARTLALGLHYEWSPPPDGGPDGPWCMARRNWAKFVRETLKTSRTLDSELQVANACKKGGLESSTLNAWLEIKPSYTPNSRPVWHDDAALQACQIWSAKGPGVIFTDHTFFAKELSRRTGMKYYGAGGLTVEGDPIEKANPNECVIASRQANSTGRNIQFWDRALVTAAPANAKEWEQMLGRLHRHGQKSDVVTFDVLVGCKEHYEGWTRSVGLADATRDLLGAPQKLLIATSEFPDEDEVSEWVGAKWK